MKQKTLVRSALIFAACGIFGCSNADVTDTARRDGDSVVVGGTAYSGVSVQEENVFGVENSGLSSNPLSPPSNDDLGSSGLYPEEWDFSLEPEDKIAFINEIVEYTIEVTEDPKKGSPNFVIQLESPAGANGSLVPVKGYVKKGTTPSSNKIIATPDSRIIKFRVMTGNAYNNKNVPMYYINVWQPDHVDDNGSLVPVSTKLFVKRPPQIGDEGVKEGKKDVENNLSSDVFKDELKSQLKEASFTLLDSEIQQLYLDVDKKLGVLLTTPECSGETSDTCKNVPAPKETVCWKLVEQNETNDGSVSTYDGKGKNSINSEGKLETGRIFWQCGETDDNGKFNVEFNTGMAYNARYYINYFHAVASPVTYTIDTFALPKTLGVPGSDAVIADENLDVTNIIDSAQENPETGKKEITGCDAAELFSKMDDETIKKIEEKCGKIDDCQDGDFTCKLVENENGTWSLQDSDGNVVKIDLGNGEGPVDVVVATDDEGNKYVNGIDTDGDGKPDIPVDPSKYDGSASNKYAVVCSKEKNGEYGPCSKIKAGLDETVPIYFKLKDSSDKLSVSQPLKLELISNPGPENNAAFDLEGGPKIKELMADDSVYKLDFWSGTAYDAQYFIAVRSDDIKSIYIPVVVYNNVNMPTAEGDDADINDAKVVPSDIDKYDPALGPVKIMIADGFNQDITVPIINTVDLNVVVVKEDGNNTIVPTTKTWWKLTRGESINNNGNITKSTLYTNSAGIASNNFYSGTGYNSLYYVTVFHPNYTDASENPIPFIFSIRTQNSTGSVDGPGNVSDDDKQPNGETTDGNGNNCKETECDNENLTTINGQPTNPSYPQGPGCGKEWNGKVLDENSTNSKDQLGCLELQVVGSASPTAMVGSTYTAKVRLVWRNGDEVTPIKDTIVWTLNKGDEADGILLSSKSTSNKNTGEATVKFKTGSKKTNYKINAMYANIHDGKNMIPTTIDLNVVDVTSMKDVTNLNKMELSVDSSDLKATFAGVNYYVMSSGYHSCGNNFIFNTTEKRQTQCESLKHSERAGNACALDSAETSDYKVIVDNRDENNNGVFNYIEDGFTVYAVAYDESGNPVGYACESPLFFSASQKPSECPDSEKYYQYKKDKSKKYIVSQCNEDPECKALVEQNPDDYIQACMSTRSKAVELKLAEVPMDYPDKYKTKTVVNLGPLMGKSSELSNALDLIADKYNQFIGENPGKKVTDYITTHLIVEDTGQATDCLNHFFSQKNKKCCVGNCEQAAGNLEQMCTEITSFNQNGEQTGKNFSDAEKEKNKKTHYTDCNCVCASLHYYAYKTKLGKLITPLAKKGIESLINKYLGADKIQDLLCGTFDSIQFVTLNGDMILKKEDNSDVFTGNAAYSGMEIPFIGDNIDLGASPLKGTWREATGDGVQLSISDYVLNFTYGEFIYAVLGKALGIFDEETGKIDLAKGLNCEKLFGGGLNLPIVGSIDAKGLVSLCSVALSFGDKYAFDFAVSKTTKLSLKLQGSGEFTRGEKNECTPADNKIGCIARNIENGMWEGTGSLGAETADGTTQDQTINGAWIAYVDTPPEVRFGTKDLATYKSENSLCREKIKEDAQKKAESGKSNRECLMGTYDNPSQRATNNLCSSDNCKNYVSVVVCTKGGKFDNRYANATEAQIIKAANKACSDAYNNKTDTTGCDSADIVNDGKGITNAECIKDNCSNAACNNNLSIVVCGDDGKVLAEDALAEVCTKNGENWDCSDKAEEACAGNCNTPGCVMNSEVKQCAQDASKPEEKEEVEDTKVPEVIASWDFKDYFKKDSDLHSAAVGSGIQAKEGEAKEKFALKYKCDNDSQLKLKMVAGTDGTVKAIGTRAVNGKSGGSLVCYFTINADADDYSIDKVEYSTMDSGRVVYFDTDGGTPTGWSNSGAEWHKATIDIKNSDAKGTFNNIRIWPTISGDENADYNYYKMMRIDDIKVWGTPKSDK